MPPTVHLRAVLIDDEPDALGTLRALLRRFHPDVEILAEAEDVQSGIEAVRAHQPNLVFMDVQMHDGTGFDVLEAFARPGFQVVFCTGFERFAVRAFRFNALDYLLKPLDPDDLEAALEKARRALAQPLAVLPDKAPERLLLPMPSGHWVVTTDDIRRIESDGGYSTLFLRDGRRSVQARPLRAFEETLPTAVFFRAHQSHLVHAACIAQVSSDFEWLVLDDGHHVPLARRRRAEFEAFFDKKPVSP